MSKVSIARTVLDGKVFYICPCTMLENELATTLKKIEDDDNVVIDKVEEFDVINPTDEFASDLIKIMYKFKKGERSKYFRGDYDKYYVASNSTLMKVFDLLELKVEDEVMKKNEGEWDNTMLPARFGELYRFFKKLENDKRCGRYAYRQILKIREASYCPDLKSKKNLTPEEEIIVKRRAKALLTLLDDLMISAQIALDEEEITPQTYMDLEALVYDARSK